MVFSSLTFLVFFLPTVVLLYSIARGDKIKNGILIAASLLFYAFGEPKWVLVMLGMVAVDYVCALMISRNTGEKTRKFFMILGVLVSLGALFWFKYSAFVINGCLSLVGSKLSIRELALPIGISFYTFQVLTYLVDVYKGTTEVQKNFFRLLLYVSFFPQLIAGPIVNYKDISANLVHRSISAEDYYLGFLRFTLGLSKKCILANPCGEIVAALAEHSDSVSGVWLLAVSFSLQLYFDFSGYSDMAIGLGRMFGFRFKENFLNPYTAESATDFWRKWHVSLGAFFREYVYIPLGGNRGSRLKWCRNLLIVWALTGIWHGASWNFMLWGLYFGILLLLEKLFLLKVKEHLPKGVNIFLTLIVVVLGWVIFYNTDFRAGCTQLLRMFGGLSAPLCDAYTVYWFKEKLGYLILAVLFCLPLDLYIERWKQNRVFFKIWNGARPVLAVLAFAVSMMLLVGQSYNPFLYFRF